MNLLLLLVGSVVILTASVWVNLSVNGEAIAEPKALAETYPKRLVARTNKRLIVRKPANRIVTLRTATPNRRISNLTTKKDVTKRGGRITTKRLDNKRITTTRRRGSRRTTASVISKTRKLTTKSSIFFGGYIRKKSHSPSAPISTPTSDTTPLYPDLQTAPRQIGVFRSALKNVATALSNTGLDFLARTVDVATRVISEKIRESAGVYGGQYSPNTDYFDPNVNLETSSPPNLDSVGEFTTSATDNLGLSLFSKESTLKLDPKLDEFNISALLDKAEQGKGEEALRELLQQIQVKVNDLKEKISNKDEIGLEQEKIEALQDVMDTIQESLNKAERISNPSFSTGEIMEPTLGTEGTEGTENTTQVDYGDFSDF